MPVITKVLTNSHGTRPVLVDFQNGKIKPGEESNLKSKLYQNVDGNAIVGITTNEMLYTGVLDKNELYNNFILVHNRENDEVQLIQIDHCSVFPRIIKQKTSQHFETGISENSISELNKQFGSKKTKRITEQRERLTMNIDAVKEQLEKSVTTETMDYNDPLLTWKTSMKSEDIKLDVFTPVTSAVQISTVGHTLTQMTAVPIHNTEIMTIPSMNQNIQHTINQINNQFTETKVVQKKTKTVSSSQTIPKKKNKKPVNGMMFHSQQLGLRMPPKKTLGIKGMVIHSQAREVIHNVYKFMKDEGQNGTRIPISNYRERVLAATGISKCTYTKITSKEFIHGINPSIRKKKKIVGDMKMDVGGSTEIQPSENDSLYRPKINRDASTRDGVYNLEDVVPSHVLDTLVEEATNIISVGSVENYGLSPFTTACISKILNNEDIKLRNITIFLYIHYLMKFMNTPMKSVTKKFVVCNKSTEVNNHILDNFSVQSQNGRTRPLHMKDKCLCYIIVLTAIANEYEVNVELLAKDLKIGMKKAMEISRILAFNASTKNKSVVTLNLPLPAPVTFNPKRKKR